MARTGDVVVATKLHIPAPRPNQVPRRRLVEMLVHVDGRRLALVTAPPGSGKTTLMAEWHAAERGRREFGWLSLDRGDNDPVRFWSCVLEAVRSVEPGFGADVESALRAPGTSLERTVVPLIANGLHGLDRRLVIALDDYHEIAEPAVHDSLALLIENLPAVTQVAIASRTDPPLPLARYRVRQELTEIRAADLGFNADEATALLNAQHGLELAPDQVARLNARTEGWAAGLQLAALSLQGRADPAAFIDSFAGDDRQVVDYLAYEVLDRLSEDMRSFLLETSLLERMCGSLCDAMTNGRGSAERLEGLLRGGLFTMPLDERQEWYRYHHLFSDLLRHELRRSRPELVSELHRRASGWFRERDLVEEAIDHALAAGDADSAEELVAVNWNAFFNRGCLATVAGWLDALPREAIGEDTRLWLAKAWTSLDSGDLAAVEPLLEAADAPAASAWKRLLRALHRFKVGDAEGARRQVAGLEGTGESEPLFWSTVAGCVEGVAAYWLDDPAAASAALDRARELAERDENHLGQLYSLGYLALIDADARDWPAADRRLEQVAVVEAAEPRVRDHFAALAARVAEGRVAEHGARPEQAMCAFERAVELAHRGGGRPELLCALLRLAGAQQQAGDVTSARALVLEARETLDEMAEPMPFEGLVEDAERRLHLAQVRATKPAASEGDALSGRELAVLRLLPTGLTQREIGDELFVSMNTVKSHLRSIYRKLDAPTREDAVGRARELGLL
jgi:LuxR family maltose regulon positive regulatory protein